jgi:hypothetical protein
MLIFFRKYQRLFFAFIAAVVIATSCFFGTFSALSERKQPKDMIITQALDSSDIKLSEIDAMSYFLALDDDINLSASNRQPNFLSSGVLKEDFFNTNLLNEFFIAYFDTLKDDFDKRVQKAKKAKFYSHPIKEISSLNVYKTYAPKIYNLIEKIQNSKETNLALFEDFASLYFMQKDLPRETLRHILFMMQKQLGDAYIDRNIMGMDFSVFSFSSVKDWFGQDLMDLISQHIINIARISKKNGYKISYNEALIDLTNKAKTGIEKNNKYFDVKFSSNADYLTFQLKYSLFQFYNLNFHVNAHLFYLTLLL